MAEATREERLLTVYADVHYYFQEPNPRPLQHRFDKGSYVYIYRNPSTRKGRLEIANYAGKPEQDAFTGLLDTVKISQSHKHPTLCSVIVDAFPANGVSSNPDEYHWRLPSTDPRDEGKFLFRLHTIDLYFWKVEDARNFIEAARSTLQPNQLALDMPPSVELPQVMSPVVEKLESVAISDPAYLNGQTRNSRSTAVPSAAPPAQVTEEKKIDPAAFTPLAYNPAAPPAPEIIKHREKTPPPPEAAAGTGLVAAAYTDHMLAQQAHGVVSQQQGHPLSPQASAGLPQSHTPSSYAPPSSSGHSQTPPAPSQGRRASSYIPQGVAPPGSTQNPHMAPTSPSPLMNQSFAPPPKAHAYGIANAPLDSPAAQILGDSYINGPPQPLAHLQPQYADYLATRPPSKSPVGGYSDYNYDESRHHRHHSHGREHEIHSQVYRPTEEENYKHGDRGRKKHKEKEYEAGPGQKPGKLEEKAEKIEKGVNSWLRKIEKKIG